MKKILVVTNMYPSKKYPHYGVFIENTVKLLRNNGYIVDVVSLKKHDSKLWKVIDYLQFFIVSIFKGWLHHYDYLYGHYVSHIVIPIKCLSILKPNMNIVLNVHGNDVVMEEEWMYRNEKRSAMILPLANTIIAPSMYFKKQLVNLYHVDPTKIVLYPSGGVDCSIFKPQNQLESKRILGLDKNVEYIGYISRVDAHKGWEIFVEMGYELSKNNDTRKLILVGSGDQNKELEQLIHFYHMEDKIIRFPLVDQATLVHIYNSLEYFIFPTYRKSESLGLVGLEAMACGCICIIANNYGPTSYLVDGENGFFFASKSTTNLVHRIHSIDQISKQEKEIIKNNAINTAKQYDVCHTSSILLDVFK